MEKCRKCGRKGEIRDLLCFSCTQWVKRWHIRAK